MKRTIVDIKIITKIKNKTKYINCFYIYFNIYFNIYLNYYWITCWISWTDFMSHSILLRILRISSSNWASLCSTRVSLWSIWLILGLGAKNLNYIMLFTVVLINWNHFYINWKKLFWLNIKKIIIIQKKINNIFSPFKFNIKKNYI